MAIVKGSLGYTTSGRKRKKLKVSKKPYKVGKVLSSSPAEKERLQAIREQEEKYPSYISTKTISNFDNSYKKEISKKYTISIAYNKGGYQVISKDNIKDIGKWTN